MVMVYMHGKQNRDGLKIPNVNLKEKENQDSKKNEWNCKTKVLTDNKMTGMIDKEHPTNIRNQLYHNAVQNLSYFTQ